MTKTQDTENLDDPRNWTSFRIANEIDCACPDSPESAGAKMLDSVRDAVVQAYFYNDQDVSEDAFSDIVSECADGGPDIYTYTMWQEFVDLAAYNEDPTELGADGSDMDQCARICLYLISERCARAVADALTELDEDESEES